jgi:chromosome segregation ATPase
MRCLERLVWLPSIRRELVDKGFSEEVLDELKEASNRYGGVKQVLEALRAYDSLKEIEKSINELEAEEKNIETAIEKKNVEYAHLQTVIKMCDSLIFKYKFSMPDVSELIELAKTYGNPADVLKTIVKYGELKKIEGEAAELSKRKVELEARIRELEKQIQELRGVAEELKSSAKSLLKPLVEEIGRGVKTMEQKFIEAIDKISTSYEEYSRKLGELKSKAKEIEELESRVQKLEVENSELRETAKIVEGEKLTLPQLRELVAKAKSEEIEANAKRLFKEYKSRWETEEKPREVRVEASRALTLIINELKKPELQLFPIDLVKIGLPDKVREIISSEVERRLDEEFYRRVEEESNRKALEKLNQLKNVEWPNWYAVNVEPKIVQLEASFRENALNLLKSPFIITCDKCGQRFEIKLTAKDLEGLLRRGYTEVECQNPNCTDSFLFSTWRHKVRISLEELVKAQISR